MRSVICSLLWSGLVGHGLIVSVAAGWTYSSVTEHCDDLWHFTGDAGLEAPTTVTNVTYYPATTNASSGYNHPPYCEVTAMVLNHTGILVWLPAEGKDWKGIFSSDGCGGSCGAFGLGYAYGYGEGPFGYDRLNRGFVTSGTDMGHQNGPNDTLSSWTQFHNNWQVKYDFAFYSTHLLAVAGKAMSEFYFKKEVKNSFWRGGSTGGRQAMMIAQRYPHDYDAIIAGYAAANETGIGAIQFPWMALSSRAPNGTFLLTNEDLQVLHAGAVEACDANDGLVDGIVDPSYHCEFDPIAVLCSTKRSTKCLASMDKVLAARKMYAGPSNSKEDQLIPSRYMPGSELEWAQWTSISGWNFAQSFTINAAFAQDLPSNWTLDQYDFETMPYQTGPMEDVYGVGMADLSIFRSRGGKMIQYHGWADANVSPEWSLNYYKKVVSLSNLTDVQSFYRSFMYPGMAHIDVGDNSTTAWRCDYYDYLEKWFYEDEAPSSLLVTRYNLTADAAIDYRPMFPWPLTPRWTGQGRPTAKEEDIAKWIGVDASSFRKGRHARM